MRKEIVAFYDQECTARIIAKKLKISPSVILNLLLLLEYYAEQKSARSPPTLCKRAKRAIRKRLSNNKTTLGELAKYLRTTVAKRTLSRVEDIV